MLHGSRQLDILPKKKKNDLDIRKNVETRFETSNYQLKRPLPRRTNMNVARF